MWRATICCLALLGFTVPAHAGELDREAVPPGASSPGLLTPTKVASATEMDRESPLQAHGWRGGWGYRPYYGGWGGYRGFGYGGFGYGGFGYRGFGYPAFYPYASYGFGGFGGFGYGGFGYGYSPYYWGYSPFGYGWYW